MSEFLLSSVSVTELNPSTLSSSIKGSANIPKTGMHLLSGGTDSSAQQESGFNKILSSIANQSSINQPNFSKFDKQVSEELFASIESLLSELEQLAPDSEALVEIRDFMNGQDMSTLGVESKGDGASLPEFLSKLDSLISSMLNDVEEGNELPMSESLDDDSIASLEAVFLQLNMIINETSKKVGEPIQSSTNSLLGFSFSGVKGRDGQWQQYDPQQMSQSEQQKVSQIDQQKMIQTESQKLVQSDTQKLVQSDSQKLAQSDSQKAIQAESKNLQNNSFITEHLVSETDKNFKAQMQNLMPEAIHDSSDIADPLLDTRSDSRVDIQDKAAIKFSDLQLRTPNEGLKPYSTTLNTPVQSQQWSDEVSQKIVWFSGRNIQAAEMHLNPADLGPIDVKIHVQNDVTTVTFNVHNASVRDLLESNVVRLREMMEANGVALGEVNVDSGGREQSQQSGSDSEQKGFGQSGNGSGENKELGMGEQEIVLKQTNLVDYFV